MPKVLAGLSMDWSRKNGVDQSLHKHIVVALADADYTVGADLALTDGGEHAYETDREADTENLCRHIHGAEQEECHESIDTLGGRQC